MSRKFQFVCLLTLLVLILMASQSGFAQSVNGPLNFGNNYFVTGDYVVGGAQGMNVIYSSGYTVGTIAIPDSNPGITGASLVPPGAEVVAALLYWQTIEKTGTVPGQAGSGENGYFMPVGSGGPKAPGYPITGVDLASNDTVPYTTAGCTTTASTGKLVRTYRANVLAALPRDSTGNISANGVYEVYLPSVGNSTPYTLGATLVLIYRILSPTVPLNSIVIYDGAYAPSTSALTMKQTLQGFYDAAPSGVSRLTQIVGQGKITKPETVYLDNTVLPSLYGREPAFPGYYGTWDNPTWTFNPGESFVRVANPILSGAASASTEVIPANSQEGCVSWGAVIVSTTVLNSDGDGLLDSWKVKPASYANPGYCDASVNEGVCTPGSASWVDLPGAVHGEKDVFIQLDYMCSHPTGGDSCTTGDGINYSFDPRLSGAMGLVTSAFTANPTVHPGVHLHINPTGTNQPDIHAIPEFTCTDGSPTALCSFPDQPGVVAWKGGFDYIKNQLVDSSGLTSDCTTTPPASSCIPRFQPGKRTSWHYVLSAHAVGQPVWKLQNGSLVTVKQSGNTVTFTTSTPVGTLYNISNIQGNFVQDPTCPNGRVTIFGAATNPSLNGAFCLKSSASPTSTSFTITVGGSATTGTFTYNTDPNLAVSPGFTGTQSGVSDVGGADSLITLGLWGNPAYNGANPSTQPVSDGQNEPVLAGTVMHELGHSIGLTHGGYTYPLLALGNYVPTLLPNCKPNFQSVMNYSFQVDLLAPLKGGTNNVPDYSGQVLASLNEAKAGAAGILTGASYLDTYWYTPYNGVGSPVTIHCDGSPNTNGAQMSLAAGLTTALSWVAGQNINFDGNSTETLQGYNDWANIDLRQIGATGTNSTAEGGGQNFGGGGQNLGGGGQSLGGGGQSLGGGGQSFGGGGQSLGGGGQSLGGGGQSLGGGGEVNVATANSVTRPPQNLTASEGAAPRAITLFWNAPAFGQIGSYNVYREVKGGSFSIIGSVTGNPPAVTYTDTTATCNATGYEYFVTAVLSNTSSNPGQQSVGSNTVINGSNGTTGQGPLTGCYTNTPPTVALTSLSVTSAPVVQGTSVPITWSLQDDYNTTSAYVNRLATNSVVAIGPFSSNQGCPATMPAGGTVTPLVTNGVVQTGTGSTTFGVNAGPNYQFTLNWDTTPFNAGCYFFKLTLDSTQTETTSSPLTLLIYVSDSSPHVTTTTLPAGTVGNSYTNTIYEAGGVSPFTWTYSGSLPSGITLGTATGMLSGTSCVAGNYSFTAKVTDSKSNYGTQGLMLQIQQAFATTSVGSSLNASTYGQTVTFTATVAPQYSCTPTGTVTFEDGGVALAGNSTVTLSGGTASFTTSALQLMAGTHSITAVYSGDTNFYATGTGGSTSPVLSQKVNQAATTTSVISSLNPSTYGQTVTFTATVAPAYAGTPSGTVTFYDGATAISGAITLSSATAGFTTTALQLVAGTHPITAVYIGDSNFYATGTGGSTAIALPQKVNQAATATSLISSLNASTYGQQVIFTATVAPVIAGTPTGTVTFYDAYNGATATAISGQIGLSASATAIFTTATTQLAAGTHSITAVYNGDSNFFATGSGGSTTTALPQTVNQAPLTITVAGTQVYGGSPSYTPSASVASGLKGTDNLSSSVTGTLSCSTTAAASSPVVYIPGYTISNCMGLTAQNYIITYAYGAFTITPAPLTVYATGVAKPYDGTKIATVILSDNRIYPTTDTFGDTYTTAMFISADVGTPIPTPVLISVTGIAISGPGATNYTLTNGTASASAIISPYPLTVTAAGANNVYDGTTTATVTLGDNRPTGGTDPGDAYTSATFASPNIGTGIPVSVSGVSASSTDYVVQNTTANTTANITPALLIANVVSSGGEAPTYSVASYAGFVDVADLNANPSLVVGTLTCTALSPDTATPSNTPISCSGLAAPNYNIAYSYSYSPENLDSGGNAPLTIAVNGTQTFGGTPVYSLTYSGFIGQDSPTNVTGTPTCPTSGTNTTPVGTVLMYTATPICSGLSVNGTNNYDLLYVPGTPGTITVTPTPLTVNVNGSAGSFSVASIVGYVNSDSSTSEPAVVTGTLTCTVDPTLSTAISCTGLIAPSYYALIYSYAGQSGGPSPAPLTVAVSGTITGQTPKFSVTYSGFINGDLPLDVAGTLSCTWTVSPSVITPDPITSCTGLSAPVTYTAIYWLGKLKITAAP